MTTLHLETRFLAADTPAEGAFELSLFNLGATPLAAFKLSYSALIRIGAEATVTNARFLRRFANFHEFAAPDDLVLAPGEAWTFTVEGLTRLPQHRLDGPKSAYVTLGGDVIPVSVGDLALVGGHDSGALKTVPEGRLDEPLAIQPWPNSVSIGSFTDLAAYGPADGTGQEDLAAMQCIGALAHRLFPSGEKPFRLNGEKPRPITFSKMDLPASAYELSFEGGKVALSYGDAAGRAYGLTALAQMHRGAATDPRFRLPENGTITDAPRYGWRGAHLDVSRHFWSKPQVMRFLDILAWGRMNVLQWHLTDDEGWRIEIKALPELTTVGQRRGPNSEMLGQLGYSHETYEGYYGQEDAREIVAHAAGLHIDVVPEIDIPGHCTAVLSAYPHLRDPDEPVEYYHSVQGYPNNALNPAVPGTYEFLETVMAEVAALFPASHIHVGSDEVDARAWQRSPMAQAMIKTQNAEDGTMALQAHLLRRTQDMLRKRGKELAGWDEVSYGGGVDPNGTLLMAWQSPAVIRKLIGLGYDVIAGPAQAYYMDMAQATGWNEPGASWAGYSTPEHTYTYEAAEGLTAQEATHVKGVQAGIWCEHLITASHFNHMVFPRLFAVAEAGWTRSSAKSWPRFAAICRQMPQL